MYISNIDIPENQLNLANSTFTYRRYKTAKTYGEQVVKIPKPLMTIINKFVKLSPKYHLLNSAKIPFLINSIGTYGKAHMILNSLTKTFGRSIGSASLRRSYATNKYKDVVDEMENDAEKMGTSVEVLKSHYIKD